MKFVASPLKEQAFEAAQNVNEAACQEVLKLMDKTAYKAIGCKEKKSMPRQNSAMLTFKKTGSHHDLILEHEQEEKDKREELRKEQEDRHLAQRERKKKKKRKRKEAKKLEELQKIKEATCQFQGCKFIYHDSLVWGS